MALYFVEDIDDLIKRYVRERDETERGNLFHEIDEVLDKHKGSILSLAILFENDLSEIIANYFTKEKEKRYEFTALILDGLNFSRKVELYKRIPKMRIPRLTPEKLNKLRNIRNKWAHGQAIIMDKKLIQLSRNKEFIITTESLEEEKIFFDSLIKLFFEEVVSKK